MGAGSHGHDIAAIWRAVHGTAIDLQDEQNDKFPAPDRFRADVAYLGVNDSRQRAELWERIERLNYRGAPKLYHPTAYVHDVFTRRHDWSSIVIGAHAYVERCSVGEHTHINYGAMFVRTMMGAFVTIGPGVHGAGDCTIGNYVMIGAGATICDRVTIGDGATIGAGAIVLPETIIPPGETWVGNPAKRLR